MTSLSLLPAAGPACKPSLQAASALRGASAPLFHTPWDTWESTVSGGQGPGVATAHVRMAWACPGLAGAGAATVFWGCHFSRFRGVGSVGRRAVTALGFSAAIRSF